MMTFFNKKKVTFSRQIFFQYFISAVVPVIVLSYFAYSSVSDLLNKNVNRQIYSESRAVGLTLYDRLLNIESNLRFSKKYVSNKSELLNYHWVTKLFNSIYIIEKGEVTNILLGNEVSDVILTEVQKSHLKNRALLTVDHNGDSFTPLMLHKIDGEQDKYIVGVINQTYLWSIYVNGNDVFCVVVDESKLVYCSDDEKEIHKNVFDNNGRLLDLKSRAKDEPHSFLINQHEYVANVWDLFIQPQYGVDSFQIFYGVRKSEAFFNYDIYKNIFPKIIFITLLIVYLLSSIQMRRSIVPLEKLTQGVKRLMDGNYGAKVDIVSNNEFKSLATAFNDMSSQINNQFLKINTLSKIDRLILSASDTDYIIEVLLQYMPEILSGEHFSFLLFNDSANHDVLIYYFKDNDDNHLEHTNLILSDKEFSELNEAESVLKTQDDKSYFDLAKQQGCKEFIAYPVRDNTSILAVILIGLKNDVNEPGILQSALNEVSDRAAVAISNARWEEKLFKQAHFDALTDLPNRYLFKDRLEQAIERAKRNDLNVIMLFIDLDRFKNVNDSLGHAIGDKLLIKVSEVLLKCVRSYDSVARFGGDEFTIVMSDLSPEEAKEKAEQLAARVISMLAEPISIDNRELYIAPSIGISIYPTDANGFDDLLKNADVAMYEAKKISAGNYRFYQGVENKKTLENMQLEVDLRHAIKKEQFELHFQPKFNLKEKKYYGVEALIRWNHPEKGVILPDVFIPIAEESGLIKSIGYWVMQEACIINKKWHEMGYDLTTAINVSAEQFRHPGFFEKIIDILEETNAEASNIVIEITESIAIEDFEKTKKTLEKLSDTGFYICIDDFGTGYSSMTYLQQFPVNMLKIDKIFVDNIIYDTESASIINAIIALAHNMNLNVVAEGVETIVQYQYINEIDCDEAQGFYYSKALSECEIIDFIEQNNRALKTSSV